MANNKVVLGNETLIDLSADSVTASAMLAGTTAHDKSGNPITGTVVAKTYRTGSTTPSNSLGENGDLYLVVP